MPRKINIDCISCGLCVQNCDYQAIYDDAGVCTIERKFCTDCGRCESICPVSAISETHSIFDRLNSMNKRNRKEKKEEN